MRNEWMPLYRRALGTDRFVARWCARCGFEGTAWADPDGGVVLRCPRCLRERVEELRSKRGSLPGAVDYLQTMARKDLAKQSLDDRSELTVDFDVFCRCDRCDALIHRDDARYWLPEGASSSPPYCRACRRELEEGSVTEARAREPDGATTDGEARDAPLHLLSVWNPSYADDAMDRHLAVLLEWAGRRDEGDAGEDDVYVWWGKLRSERREQELPHRDEVLALAGQIADGVTTHLYLTDHRSLYVGRLVEITDDPVLEETPGELDHMPGYYQEHDVDFWFMLWDLRRLVQSDTPAVIEELKKLRNVRYHDRPVSLYGGLVDLPLLVRREDEAGWFEDMELLTGGRRWAERDATLRGETERMARSLRDDLLGERVWNALEPAARTFLASAEAVFRARRDDPGFDFSGPVVEYAKAVETELNAVVFGTLREALSGKAPAERQARIDGRSVDLGGKVPHQSLGTLRNLLEHDGTVRTGLKSALGRTGTWLVDELPYGLKPIVRMRNPAAHDERADPEEVKLRRRRILGIGCRGLLVRVVEGKG